MRRARVTCGSQPDVLHVRHLGAQVEHGPDEGVGHVEQSDERDLRAAEQADPTRPRLDREQRAEQRDRVLLVERPERRSGGHGDVGAVGGAAVVELGGQPGVVQRLPVPAYDVGAGVVRQQLERVHPGHGRRA